MVSMSKNLTMILKAWLIHDTHEKVLNDVLPVVTCDDDSEIEKILDTEAGQWHTLQS